MMFTRISTITESVKAAVIAGLLLALSPFGSGIASGQSWQMNTQSYALKTGESVEIGDLYWVVNCRSQLLQTPEVTIMEAPPGIIATISEAMVVPRFQQCPNPVKGGKLKLTAEKVDDQSNSIVTLRIRYVTKDGIRDKSMTFSLALFP